ncbi:MAG TPA: response regulator [Dehalococcoidia bacterium]|nr:response regulator [Dehalococcoidia bacterium]
MQEPTTRTKEQQKSHGVVPEARPTILVVEDDERIQRLVELVLRGEGYSVLQAGDGRQALDMIDSAKPDLVLLDLMLPVLDGWALRERLRQRPTTSDIPIILMSAVRNLPEAAQELEVADYLSKPFEIDDLVRSVRRRLDDLN